MTRQWFGVYIARVTKTRAQDNWVKLQVPQILGTAETAWAAPMGYVTTGPATGSLVQVMFVGGDINHPVYHLYAQANDTSGQSLITQLHSQVGTVPATLASTVTTADSTNGWATNPVNYIDTFTGSGSAWGSGERGWINHLAYDMNALIVTVNEMRTALINAGIL